MVIIRSSFVCLAALLAGCNVSTPPGDTGPVSLSPPSPDAGEACDKGHVVVLTDYMSTQIALTAPDGTVLSPSFLSTASTKTSGVAYALSGDVTLPSTRPPSGRVVLLDRFGTNVVTWAEPTGTVVGQLPVGAGFESNPQDYVETDTTHALVSRWGINKKPGAMPFDSGSDVLVVDSKAFAIRASIAMPATGGLPPRPAGMVRVGTTTLVVLQNLSDAPYTEQADSVVVGVVNDKVAWQTTVTGLKGCNRPALSPSGKLMALACEGHLDPHGNVAHLAESGVIVYDVSSLPPKEVKRFAVSDQLGDATQDRVSFATETLLVGKTQTALAGTTSSRAFTLDTATGKAAPLLTASLDPMTGKGKGLVYGDFVCDPGCADVCLLADADVGKLQRWSIHSGKLKPLAALELDPLVGLSPTAIAGY